MKYSLVIGRFQPLHTGHIRLIRKLLEEGKPVLVALRDTPHTTKDPYTIAQRRAMFRERFGNTVRVIVIPDIAEVVHGRDVGWTIREIRLDAETEAISGTTIRRGHG